MAIDKLTIDNFKCFDHQSIKLGKLSILTGANSAGKSTIIQAILYCLQSIGMSGENTLNGKYVKLGKISDVKNCYTRGEVHVDISTTSLPELSKDNVVYLSTNRIGPEPEYKQNEELDTKVGIHGEYAFSFLSRNRMEQIPELDFIYDNETGKNFGNQVDYWLHYFCGYKVIAEEIEGTSTVKVSFQTDDFVRNYRAVDVGTGVTCLAVIIIAALSCSKNDILIIENPELYLHPAAQSKFMEFFSFLSRKGLQVIIETHSDHIINGVRKEIKRRHISSEEVSMLYVQKENNKSFVENIHILDNGAIANPMRGFFDQIDDDLDVLLGFEK